MAGSFGGYNDFDGFVDMSRFKNNTSTDKYGGYFTNKFQGYSELTKEGIFNRARATAQREAKEQEIEESSSFLAKAAQQAEAMQEGDIAFGRLGRNYPGDTRMASTLAALGIAPDFMSAIIQSAQLPPWGNR